MQAELESNHHTKQSRGKEPKQKKNCGAFVDAFFSFPGPSSSSSSPFFHVLLWVSTKPNPVKNKQPKTKRTKPVRAPSTSPFGSWFFSAPSDAPAFWLSFPSFFLLLLPMLPPSRPPSQAASSSSSSSSSSFLARRAARSLRPKP